MREGATRRRCIGSSGTSVPGSGSGCFCGWSIGTRAVGAISPSTISKPRDASIRRPREPALPRGSAAAGGQHRPLRQAIEHLAARFGDAIRGRNAYWRGSTAWNLPGNSRRRLGAESCWTNSTRCAAKPWSPIRGQRPIRSCSSSVTSTRTIITTPTISLPTPRTSSIKGTFRPGGALKMIDLGDGGRITTLLETETGVIRDPRVHWDGQRIVFSMRQIRRTIFTSTRSMPTAPA
jgi:hypothetical protein